eukprot:CAMPEP_0113965632 /NCGR_PEP_ID=MMETSP0011_2-20120614/7853_1 /TAXON_ID=101924 /ORGANISM="Rhodosorus marinus" /LENGTH=309 /DNA_ID=CAMNT_0000978167 /DNA_START=381 /DNA_END=1310 /DNA_ORIENTATION=- /assembly_acc=CAM_ASM_000156
MDQATLIMLLPAVFVGLCMVVIIGLLIRSQRQGEQEADREIEELVEEAKKESRAGRSRVRGSGRIRQSALRSRRAGRALQEENQVVDEGQGSDAGPPGEDASAGDDVESEGGDADPLVFGKGKKKKEANKEAKRQRAAALAAEVERQNERRKEMDEERRLRDEEREELERAREEEAMRKQAEKEEKERLEFEKWKDSFTVDSVGSGADDVHKEPQNLLKEFVDYIRSHKVIVLEELAAHFKLRTEEVINRVNDLESEGTITGVFDDRGKFICIEEEEMAAVAEYINKKGRVTISDLSLEAGKLINLTAS